MTDTSASFCVSVTQELILRGARRTESSKKKFIGKVKPASYTTISLLRWKQTFLKWKQLDSDRFAWNVSSWKNPGTPEGDEVFDTACSRMGWGSMLVITYFSSMTIISLH